MEASEGHRLHESILTPGEQRKRKLAGGSSNVGSKQEGGESPRSVVEISGEGPNKRLKIPSTNHMEEPSFDRVTDMEKEVKQLRIDVLSAKNACLKAKLDCEQARCRLYEKDKIIAELSENVRQLNIRLDAQARIYEGEICSLKTQIKHESEERANEQQQMAQLVQLLNQIEKASKKHDVNFERGETQFTKAIQNSVIDIQYEPSTKDFGNEDERQTDEDPNASAIIPVDEEKLKQVEEQKKIEAMLKIEIPPEALAEVTKQPGLREDFPVDTSDAKPVLKPVPDKRKREFLIDKRWKTGRDQKPDELEYPPAPEPANMHKSSGPNAVMSATKHGLRSSIPPQSISRSINRLSADPLTTLRTGGSYSQMGSTNGLMPTAAGSSLSVHPNESVQPVYNATTYHDGYNHYPRERSPSMDQLPHSLTGPTCNSTLNTANDAGRRAVQLSMMEGLRGTGGRAESVTMRGSPIECVPSRDHAEQRTSLLRTHSRTSLRSSSPKIAQTQSPPLDETGWGLKRSISNLTTELPTPAMKKFDSLTRNSISEHPNSAVAEYTIDTLRSIKEVTIFKAAAALHRLDNTRNIPWKECDRGTVAVKAILGQPETARLVMYNDCNDKKVINFFLSFTVALKVEQSDLIVTTSENGSPTYFINLGSVQGANDLHRAIRTATSALSLKDKGLWYLEVPLASSAEQYML
ncbi:uncharacterized protein SPPG_07422 [Spizellomyces punctatus DAOM BR117]|uniref:Uncharacterized protein n=1 Tax=Spizellomyces punctatus (strain DAOM BR117) TaxID=645134 RepID=A0A0L0H8G9_SPIPD|nr:uncharacterized protein SPPG_07422 [Spizellomyces punctatus DAOM BR117]KNC97507.1 hypothetical protein SPPG_07422 [Spizellomyces punctatus DAOM BR117]|eukprot:XP_016605547.1 hypothetical protein SPPG_07422 [Spizellomyces punctatus DAOM BR117]